MTKLSERTMLACLHVGAWGGQMRDDVVSEDTNERHNADLKTAGNYTKRLLDRKVLLPVVSATGNARAVHRLLTLPWDDDARILTTMGYAHYTEQMRLKRLSLQAAVADLIEVYPDYIKSAANRERLGKMYNPDDYPSVDDLKKRFYIDVEIKPVVEAGDFRAELGDASVKAIVKDIEKRSNARVEQALSDVFERIVESTGRMVEKLREYKPAQGGQPAENNFRDSLVYNIKGLADLLPSLNITDDKRLTELAKQMEVQLLEHSPEILKVNDRLRQQTADRAQKIYDKVKKYL